MKTLKMLLLVSIFTGAAVMGWLLAEKGNGSPAAAEENPRISLKTEFSLKYCYAMCAHEETEEKERFVGMDREEFEQAVGAVSVKEFSADKVTAQKQIRAYCPRHEIVKLVDGSVCVVSTRKGSDVLYIRRDLGIAAESLDPEYLDDLKQGMIVTAGRSVRKIAEMICMEK